MDDPRRVRRLRHQLQLARTGTGYNLTDVAIKEAEAQVGRHPQGLG